MRRIHRGGVEGCLVGLVALHSLTVGCLLLFLHDWSAPFGGWHRAEPRFFVRQGGVFHIVVALGYLYEYLRYRSVGLLLVAKSIAVVFLVTVALTSEPPAWAVPASALADGLMALAVAWVARWARAGGVD